MMKTYFTFYIRANRPQKGHQTNNIGVVSVKLDFMQPSNQPIFRVGVTVKNPRDGEPFVNKAGRAIAEGRADSCLPVFSLVDLRSLVEGKIYRASPDWKRMKDVPVTKLLDRIMFVMERHADKKTA